MNIYNLIKSYFYPERTVRDVLKQLSDDFCFQEKILPYEGYRVLFEETPTLRGRLIPMGSVRTTPDLSGMPGEDYSCPFCAPDLKASQVFEDHCRQIHSHSGQLLLIPDTHYSHWFAMPIEEQEKLLRHALELRSVQKSAALMELHCGSAGYQTVFHTHLRTGVKI